jgi:imidazolonepropionase-like amidohydrolase
VTINPARQLRIDNRVGSIEVGKDADVVIWNKHPLSTYAIVDRVYIDGQRYYDRQDDAQRQAELAKEKEALINAERGERRGPTTTESGTPRDPRASSGGPNADDDLALRLAQGERSSDSARGEPVEPRATSDRSAKAVALQTTSAAGARPRTATRGVVAITNAKIFPIAKPAIDRGTIVIRDGVIEAVGANVSVPPGAHIIDAAGAEVYPGFINAQTTMGLEDPGAGGFGDANEILDFNPQLRAQVAFHNDSEAIPVARANGMTTVVATPGGGLLGGQAAVMDLDGFTWEESTVAPSVGVTFQFPRIGGGGRGGGGRGQAPDRPYDELKKERDAQLDRVARLVDDARAYAKAGPDRRRDLILESLLPIVDKRQPLITRVSTEAEIRDAIAFADRVGVRLVIAAPGSEAVRAAALLKEKSVPVIVLQVLVLPARQDFPHQASYAAAGELVKAGVKIALAVPSETNARQLPYHAAEAVGWGLPRDEALKALTINVAEIFGVADRIGSIEPGKIANLIVAKGDPLEIRTPITHVLIAGKTMPPDNRQLELYERYAKRP